MSLNPISMRIAILADDLTGACDSAVPFARHGLTTCVLLAARPIAFGSAEPAEVVAVDADTRRLSRRLAVARTSIAAQALRPPPPSPASRERGDVSGDSAFSTEVQQEGADGRQRPLSRTREMMSAQPIFAPRSGAGGEGRMLFKKVDSTLRGHVGPEILACLRAWDTPLALLCPAFPAAGRWVQGGQLFVDGRGTLGRVAKLAGLPLDRRTGHLTLDALRGGVEAVKAALVSLSQSGARVIVADADTPGHLTTLVEAVFQHPSPVLLAGAGGLAGALATWAANDRESESLNVPGASPDEDGPPWLVIVGSQTEVSRHQVVELERAGAAVLPLQLEEALERRSVASGIGRRAAALLRDGVTPVIALVVPPGLEAAQGPRTRLEERAGRALARACQVALERSTPGGLFLTGGLTARACLLALGVAGLRLEREPLPGIAAGVALGGAWDGRAVITKAGGFGAPDAMRRLVRPRSPLRTRLPTARSTPPGA